MKTSFAIALCCLGILSAKPPVDLLSFSVGAFDFYRDRYRAWEFGLEYKFAIQKFAPANRYLTVRPLLGVMGTSRGSFYGYGGVNFELLFAQHVLFAPGFAAGYFSAGKGKNLGYPLEFRSGVELGWQFADSRRVGVHFYHLSNASLSGKNPGEESFVLFYDVPLESLFSFACN